MSTLATTNIKHPSSASNNIVLDSSGNVVLQAGSASTPALQPSGDTNTGIFFPAADTIAFAEGGVESARIDSSGRLLVGTSTSLESTALIQAYKSSGAARILLDSDSLSNDQIAAVVIEGGGRRAQIGSYKHSSITNPCSFINLAPEDDAANYIWVDNSDQLRISTTATHVGTTSGTVVGAQTSDERIKNILGPVEYGLTEIKQLEPVNYALKSDPEQTPHLGFIAQQVNPIIPESIFDTDDHIEGEPEDAPTKLGMEYVALIPVLVNAIKELSAQNAALETRLAALEGA